MTRVLGLATLACLAIAGCKRDDRPPQDHSVERAMPAPSPPARPSPAPSPPAKPVRSIMRPAVVSVPAAEPPPPPPRRLTLSFATSGGRLDDAQKRILDGLAARIQQEGDRLILRGSTDSRGSDARNLLVSRRRARLVAAYLEGKGIARDRIIVVALGEDRPVAPNRTLDGQDDPHGRAQNRRVDIEIVPLPAGSAVPGQ